MSPRAFLVVSILCASAAGGAVAWFVVSRAGDARAEAAEAAALERVLARVADLEAKDAERRGSFDEARQALRAATESLARRATEQVVAGAVPGDSVAEGVEEAATKAPKAKGPPLAADAAVKKLLENKMSDEERERFWQEVRDAGLMDEVIKAFEARVNGDPKNPDFQTELAEAYIQKITEVGSGPLAGVYGTKADKAYDAALAVDPEHWNARFGKAIALSFWPPALGKQGEAIKHFELLLAQQERRAARPEFAHTYLFLGNMYLQQGKSEAALATWRKGQAAFPDNAELAAQITNAVK